MPELLTLKRESLVVIQCSENSGHPRFEAASLKEAVDLWLALPREKKKEGARNG